MWQIMVSMVKPVPSRSTALTRSRTSSAVEDQSLALEHVKLQERAKLRIELVQQRGARAFLHAGLPRGVPVVLIVLAQAGHFTERFANALFRVARLVKHDGHSHRDTRVAGHVTQDLLHLQTLLAQRGDFCARQLLGCEVDVLWRVLQGDERDLLCVLLIVLAQQVVKGLCNRHGPPRRGQARLQCVAVRAGVCAQSRCWDPEGDQEGERGAAQHPGLT
eukprot:CAMPEP_0185189194 /NCGR_PEP_ID=MMETSP1140-20130426/5877_1 /TAXON_ID=298111 /ORGANISM="Pavlova sp., Strain CCMP459" /LENGTH=218 /DNA_ID=CAMNT_0027755739 /DNA_START=789 /DNA_END=1441 /DNA_ORIENTATION=+